MRAVLGVTGCIGAYKAAYLLRLLQQEGFHVVPVMTQSAQQFIGPLTLEKLSGSRVITGLFEAGSAQIEHISVARDSDILIVAPATANILAKFATGIADDFLTTLYLSTKTPVVIAPAMNVEMWRHPATVENLAILRKRGIVVVDPGSGYQACGEYGEGRLAEPEEILASVLATVDQKKTLQGKRIMITAGPTIEDIDPVRFLSNRSSGKMGYSLAAEAARRGGIVELVSGPTSLESPQGVKITPVRSAGEMAKAVLTRSSSFDIFVGAAAVADFRPKERASEKLKKQGARPSLELEPTIDILAELPRRDGLVVVGFAAESENLRENAVKKLESKSLDLIVANAISGEDSAFQSDYNTVFLCNRDGREESLPRMTKKKVAQAVWDRIELLVTEPDEENRLSLDPRTEVDH